MKRTLTAGLMGVVLMLTLSGCVVKKWEYLPGDDNSIEQELKYARERIPSENEEGLDSSDLT